MENFRGNTIMKICDFFRRLEKEFGITPHHYCKIFPISYRTLKRYINGLRPTRDVAKKIQRITGKRITMKDMGFEDDTEED